MIRIASIALGLAALAACGGGDTAEESIAIGVVTPQTGDLASAGENQLDSILLAVDEINRGGGVLGRNLRVIARDDGTTPQGATTAYAQLLAADVAVVLGPVFSSGVVAITDQIRTGQTVTISGGATSPALTDIDDDRYFFRTIPSDAVQAIVLAQKIRERALQRVCIVYRDDAYGIGLSEELHARLADLAPVDAPYDPASPSLSEVMIPCEPVRTAEASGAVFVTFGGDGAQIVADAAARGWDASRHGIFFVDGNRRLDVFSSPASRAAFEGSLGTAPTGPDDQSAAGARLRAFQEAFDARYMRAVQTNGENHYDSAYLAAIAIEIAGTDDSGPAIRDAMGQTGSGAEIPAGDWAALRAAIANQGQVDYQGASGDVDLDVTSGEPLPPYYVRLWTLEQGQIEDREVVTVSEP